ncbi:hypothetical protein MTR67_027015 [Solanum verrucosum]|uniref:Uncharacterized protein n=1 Tax=Solanum verrucosum TaxID=315347 RepID=A0AAF0R6L6_SOLVR|nr:hypothetical protein MTR67_027015 [Solanum verrucosum]
MLTQANREEGERRRGVESVNYFQQEKISVQYIKILDTRVLHVRFEMLHNYCNSEIVILYLVMNLIILSHFG